MSLASFLNMWQVRGGGQPKPSSQYYVTGLCRGQLLLAGESRPDQHPPPLFVIAESISLKH